MTPVFLLRYIYSGKRIPQNEGLLYVFDLHFIDILYMHMHI